MTEKKDSVFKKVLGVFVESEEGGTDEAEPAARPAKSPISTAPRKPSSAPPVPRAPTSSPAPAGGSARLPSLTADRFAAVYDRAGIDTSQQERVTKALTLLDALPEAAPADTKRQIVEASLTAFGFPVEEIQAAGEAEVAALDAFVASANEETETRLSAARSRIEELNAEIVAVKKSMEEVMATQARIVEATDRERERVNEVLTFFGPKK